MLARLNELTQLELVFNGVVGDLPEDFSTAWNDLRHGSTGPFSQILDDDTYTAYVPMLDQSRKPVALLRNCNSRYFCACPVGYLLLANRPAGVGPGIHFKNRSGQNGAGKHLVRRA